MRRRVVPELLDSDSGTPQEVEDSLADLRMFNRYFGGAHTMTALLTAVADARQLKQVSFLDVAGASGDVALRSGKALKGNGIELRPVVLDRAESHLNGSIPSVCGDALALPFRDSSFDVVGCSLFVHHLEPDEIVHFAREALRVARYAFVINDLIRHPLHLGLVYAGFPLYRSRITRHDTVASVRRAYTSQEMRRMLEQSGATDLEIRMFYLFRMGVIAWKRPSSI